MNKVGVAAQFRHIPDEDGNFIPASTILESGPRKGGVAPIIGYLAYSFGGEIRWSFLKYEAPESYAPGEKGRSRKGQIATTRVAHLRCHNPQCEFEGPYPVKGDARDIKCPECGKDVESRIIKENSDEFFEMVGDLREGLEKAAVAAENSDLQFEYPEVLVVARNIDLSASIPPDLVAHITKQPGFGAKPIREVEGFEELLSLQDSDPCLLLVPGIASGFLDAEEAKKGWSQGWPVFGSWARLWLPERKHRGPMRFAQIRF
jgi:hypothetical protein